MAKKQIIHKILIAGCGPSGMLTALYLSQLGFKPILIGKLPDNNDERTTALMLNAIDFLKKLNIWKDLKFYSAPLRFLRLVDGTNRILRSPTICFNASEVKKAAFGYNIPNQILNKVLIKNLNNIQHINSRINQVTTNSNVSCINVSCILDNNQIIEGDILIAADGKNSFIRQALNIKNKIINHQQIALISQFEHEFSHNDTSTEIHTNTGPFTQVPLLGNNSSLIWTVNKEQAEYLKNLPIENLNKQIEHKLNYILGKIKLKHNLQTWLLSSSIAEIFAKDNVFLIGEAAHSFPPIGAQGLNLSIRDIQDLGFILSKTSNNKLPNNICNSYNKYRKADIYSRAFAVNNLNKSLISDKLIWQIIRAGSFQAIKQFKPLKKLFINEGLVPNKFILKFIRLLP